jgi:LuxR family maltose regulon positive regulatory protein
VGFEAYLALEECQLWLDEGRFEEALAHLHHANLQISARPTRHARDWLGRVGTVVSLAVDDLAVATEYARDIRDPFWRPISRARVLMAQGELDQALASVADAQPRSLRHDVVLHLTRARATRDTARRSALVSAVVAIAAPVGLLQTVASEGSEVVEWSEHAAWIAVDVWTESLRRLAATTGALHAAAPPSRYRELSERERQVMRALASRLTQREIADHLGVSTNTIKYHVKAIYRKLGVVSRADAVSLVRQSPGSKPAGGRHRRTK